MNYAAYGGLLNNSNMYNNNIYANGGLMNP